MAHEVILLDKFVKLEHLVLGHFILHFKSVPVDPGQRGPSALSALLHTRRSWLGCLETSLSWGSLRADHGVLLVPVWLWLERQARVESSDSHGVVQSFLQA